VETLTYPLLNISTGQVTNEKLTLVAAVDLGNLSAMTMMSRVTYMAPGPRTSNGASAPCSRFPLAYPLAQGGCLPVTATGPRSAQ
jgi:hypothetical protein